LRLWVKKTAVVHSAHFGRYNDAKTAIYPFKVIQGHWFWYQSKARVHIPISDQ